MRIKIQIPNKIYIWLKNEIKKINLAKEPKKKKTRE
jgi:hypothetical protein